MFVVPVSVPVQRRVVRASLPRAFAQLVNGVEAAAAADATRLPALDVLESDGAYTLRLDLPGADKERLKVSVQGRRVSVETVDAQPEAAAQPVAEGAAVEQPQPAAPALRTLYSERRAPRFARTVSLPAEVDEAASEARFDNGVLTLTLGKKVKAGATRISVA